MTKEEWITHCPQCGHDKVKIKDTWLEVGIDGYHVYFAHVECSNCDNDTSILR